MSFMLSVAIKSIMSSVVMLNVEAPYLLPLIFVETVKRLVKTCWNLVRLVETG